MVELLLLVKMWSTLPCAVTVRTVQGVYGANLRRYHEPIVKGADPPTELLEIEQSYADSSNSNPTATSKRIDLGVTVPAHCIAD